MRLLLPLVAGLAAGCSSNVPHWAIDPIFLTPDGDGAVGDQLWQIYAKGWKRRFSERHYLCAALVTFDANPTSPDCEDCDVAFTVDPEVADSDCSPGVTADALFIALARVGFGGPSGEGPHPASAPAYVDWGRGWERWGWAHPEALDRGAAPASDVWDGAEPFALVPTHAWDLTRRDASAAGVSRSARGAWWSEPR